MSNRVVNGDSVLVHVRGDRSYVLRVIVGKPVDIYRQRLQGEQLIGLLYKGWYILRGEKSSVAVERVADPTVQSYTALTADGEGDALDALCDEGAEDIKQTLIASESYQGRSTEFSKQKAVARARKRHTCIFTIEFANPYNLCSYVYTGRTPETNLFMSPGNYALLIQHTDAARMPGFSRVLVYDDLDGRVSAGIASRMVLTDAINDASNTIAQELSRECEEVTAQCQLLATFEERHALGHAFLARARQQLRLPNYDQEIVAVTGRTLGVGLKNALIDANVFPSKHGLEASRANIAPFVCTVNATKFATDDDLQLLGYSIEDQSAEAPNDSSADDAQVWTPETLTHAIMIDYDMWLERKLGLLKIAADRLRKVVYEPANKEHLPRALRQPLCAPLGVTPPPLTFDVLVVVARSRPLPLIQLLSKFIRPAAPVSVYSHCSEALAELGHAVAETRSGHLLSYNNNRILAYQVLPGRTRPAMLEEAFGGCVLTYYAQLPSNDSRKIFRKARNVMQQKKKALKQ